MVPEEKLEIDGSYCPDMKSRWNSYGNYRLIVWAWMMNEITVFFAPSEISHNGFYAHAAIQALAVIVMGMPLAYSEICLAQYTNCDIFTMWDFFPLFKNIGYATLYLIFLKTVYSLVLTSWYLVYTFYSALDVPPWLSCDDYDDNKCMVKRINVSIFQHCLEAQILFEDDCGMKTASNCFFEREIGGNCTYEKGPYCFVPWKTILAVTAICVSIYVLSLKKEKFIQILVKFTAFYVCFVVLVLFCVAMSTKGTWYATKININWSNYTFLNCFTMITRGFLSVGAGYGILIFLTRDVAFRSPATMTSISTPLFSLFASFMLALIAFSGIKTMSYYHGEEENVIEIGTSLFFPMFASMSEILSYFDMPVWGFLWFSLGFFCLYVNFWIVFLFLKELSLNTEFGRNYTKLSSMFLLIFIIICSLPFLCSDLTSILSDAIDLMQSINCLFLSVALYWCYGIHNHTVDIIFMIGIKSNHFLKLAWVLNPVFICVTLFARWEIMKSYEYQDSYYIESIEMTCDLLIMFILLSIYGFIICVGILVKVIIYYNYGDLRELITAQPTWGPHDRILYRSRQMFVPEIMTREFLYRQVRIRGYYKRDKAGCKKREVKSSDENLVDSTWSAMTSN